LRFFDSLLLFLRVELCFLIPLLTGVKEMLLFQDLQAQILINEILLVKKDIDNIIPDDIDLMKEIACKEYVYNGLIDLLMLFEIN